MANSSILAAFERMWQHIIAKLGNKVDKSGDTVDGQLLIGNTSGVKTPAETIEFLFLNEEGHIRNKLKTDPNNRFYITQQETGATYAEAYMLPTLTPDLTKVEWYKILTSKETITVAQGGTGSTDGATGLKNLFAAGTTVLSSHQYGTSLPAAGTKGRIFFKKA